MKKIQGLSERDREKARKMAGLNQDLNSNAVYGHSTAAMKKDRLTFSGRKPLGDLSNYGKPFLKNPSKKVVTKKNFPVVQEEIKARAKNISKAPKRDFTNTKKVLADVSNLGKSNSNELTTLTEEPFDEEDIPVEGFDHNHQECIKAQYMTMDMDHFFETFGLANGFSQELPSLNRPESPPRVLEMMHEESLSDRSAKKFDESPPTSPDRDQMWKDINDWIYPIVNFKLADSPKLLKH